MEDWKIVRAISDGIERGLSNVTESINDNIGELFKNLVLDCVDIVMDIGVTASMILLVYCMAKFIVITDKKKREDNENIMVCAGGMLFIFKMLARLAS